MDSEIDDVVTSYRRTTPRVIESKREVREGPAGNRAFGWRRQNWTEWPQAADRVIVGDRRCVVEDQWP